MIRRTYTVTPPAKDLGGLSQPPHVITEFIDMLEGRQPLSVARQEQRWEHVADCLDCQVFLGNYLAKLVEHHKAKGIPAEIAEELLKRLTQLIELSHETLKEDIPAYVEALEELSEEDANQRFPQFSEHVRHCPNCQEAVTNLREWLRHLKDAKLM